MSVISQIPPFPVRKFTVDEYRRLGETGVLTEDDRVELLEGWIVPKMNHNPLHDGTIELVEDQLRRHLPGGWRLRIQSVITTEDSEPEPDLAVVRGPAGRYIQRHPGQTDIGLVVEVSDTSLSRDRDKCRIYASAGIVAYWIVNLVDRRIEVYTEPADEDANPGYRGHENSMPGNQVPFCIEDQQLALVSVDLLLP